MRFDCAVVWILLVLSALPAVAYGQSYEAALLDGVSARDRAIDTGDASDWQRAAQHFARARELRSTKEAEFEFAEATLRLGRWLEAYAAYEAALELGLEGKAARRARAFLAEHAARVARLVVDGPPGARIHVGDGAGLELPLPRPLVVPPGTLELRVEQDGFRTRRWRLEVAASSSTTLEVRLEPARAPLPARLPPISPRREPDESLARPPAWAAPLTLSGGSLLVVGGVGVLTTSLLLSGERKELRRLCLEFAGDECATAPAERRGEAQSVADRIETLENVRWVTLAAAGVGLLGAAVGFASLLEGANSEAAQQARLQASAQGFRLEWQGTF